MSDTALYYTFSTIAQALAGVFSVLAAFALFRLTGLEHNIATGQNALRSVTVLPYEQMWPVLRDRGYEALLEFIKQEAHGATIGGYERLLAPAHTAWRVWKAMRSRLHLAVGATAADIAICVVALPLVPHLTDLTHLSLAVVATTVVLSLACLVLYWRLIMSIVEPRG